MRDTTKTMKMKERLISDFKSYCNSPIYAAYRRNSVLSQWIRNAWETTGSWQTDDGIGKIRICGGDFPKLMAWALVGSKLNWPDIQEVVLSKQEYSELEKCYFGNYVPDYNYLIDRLGVTGFGAPKNTWSAKKLFSFYLYGTTGIIFNKQDKPEFDLRINSGDIRDSAHPNLNQ